MSFNVEITFTGLCIFVPRSDTDTGLVRMCVVLPDARSERQYALDGSWLKPHTGFVSFNQKDLVGGSPIPSRASVFVFLDGYRLTLEAQGGVDEPPDDLEGIPNLNEITDGHGTLRSSALTSSPRDVVGQVLIKRGSLKAGDRLHKWVIPQTLGGPVPKPKGLSHEVILTLPEVDSFSILAKKFGFDTESWNFSVDPGETLRVKVGNLCGVTACRCYEPHPLSIPEPDEDFKWHYQLLQDRTVLQERLLSALPLPIPMPEDGGAPAAQGINCIPAVAAPADINTLLD